MNDRLGELLQFGQGNPFLDVADEPPQEPFLDEFFSQVDVLRSDLKSMRVDSRSKKRAEHEIEELVRSINQKANINREKLKKVASSLPSDDRTDGLNTQERIMKNAHKSLMKEFLGIMQDYQTMQNNYNEKSRSLVKAQVLVANPDATEADIEKAIEQGPEQVFAQGRRQAAQESYDYIQHRHNEILKIEKSLEEVHQLFVDMAVLVDEQSEVIDRVAFQVSNVKADIRLAAEELREANKIKRRQCVIQ